MIFQYNININSPDQFKDFRMLRIGSCFQLRMNLSAVAVLGLTLTTSAPAGDITFNPTGDGIASDNMAITGLNFGPGNFLAVGAIDPATGTLTTSPFTVLFQTHLDSVTLANGQVFVPAGLNTAYQITEVAAVREQVDLAHSTLTTANFVPVPNSGSQFNIYFNSAVTYNDGAGTGFTDGKVIMTKSPISYNVANFTDTTASSGASRVPFNQTSSIYTPSPTATADQGSGLYSSKMAVDSYLPSFFQPASGQPLLATAINATNEQSFFDVIPPSAQFTDLLTNTTITPGIGSNNGSSGPDFQFQALGYTESFNAVPEPASIWTALTALGIVPLVVFKTRRRGVS